MPLPTATQFKPLRGSEPFPWTFLTPGVQPKIGVKISTGRGWPGDAGPGEGERGSAESAVRCPFEFAVCHLKFRPVVGRMSRVER